MRASSIESAIKEIESNKSLFSTYAHYASVKGRCSVEDASRYIQEELGIWGESGNHYNAVVFLIESIVNNFYVDMEETESTLEQEEKAINEMMIECLRSEYACMNKIYECVDIATPEWIERCELYFESFELLPF